jgi:hypothetical protein
VDRFELRLLEDARSAALDVLVIINGEERPDGVDPVALVRAARGDELVFPFVCTCGDPGCGGYFGGVTVVHVDGSTIWEDRDRGEQLVFETAQFRTAIERMHARLADAAAVRPGTMVGFRTAEQFVAESG